MRENFKFLRVRLYYTSYIGKYIYIYTHTNRWIELISFRTWLLVCRLGTAATLMYLEDKSKNGRHIPSAPHPSSPPFPPTKTLRFIQSSSLFLCYIFF